MGTSMPQKTSLRGFTAGWFIITHWETPKDPWQHMHKPSMGSVFDSGDRRGVPPGITVGRRTRRGASGNVFAWCGHTGVWVNTSLFTQGPHVGFVCFSEHVPNCTRKGVCKNSMIWIQVEHSSLYCALLYELCRYYVFFYKGKVHGNLASNKSIRPLSSSICSPCLSHFSNSHNVSNFLITIVSVVVIYNSNLWCYYYKNNSTRWRLRWWLIFFSDEMFLNEIYFS